MPIIRMDFDDAVVAVEDAHQLSLAMRDIISHQTGIEDVFVYANSAQIKV